MEQDTDDLSGRWEFHYFDANGTHYQWSPIVEHKGGYMTAASELYGWQLKAYRLGSVSLSGRVTGGVVDFELRPDSLDFSPIRFNGIVANTTGRYYMSLYGTAHPMDSSRMRGGVWIAFKTMRWPDSLAK